MENLRTKYAAAVDTWRSHKASPFFLLPTVVLIIASLYWAQAVLLPIAVSILLTFLLTPVADKLERLGLGRIVSVILIVILAFSFLGAVGWVVTRQLTSVANELPTYRQNIRKKIVDVRGVGKGGALEKVQKTAEEMKKELERRDGPAQVQPKPREVVVQGEQSSTFWPVPLDIAPMLERLASGALAITLLIFMLLQREDLRNRLIRLIGFGRLTVTTKALEEASQRISRYLLMQSIINTSFGIAVGIALYFIGLPYAPLWGFLAAMLRFIPYVGTWVAVILPSVLSLIVFQGWLLPALVVAVFLVLELINNMILEPSLYGESAGVSEVGLLVAVAFWTWLWGPVGLLLATPLTVCVVVLSKYVPQLEFISVLMSDEPVMESDVSYYQRLLAGDQDEAAEILEEHLKDHPIAETYDNILVPALNYARRDRAFGRLAEDDQQFIYQATREILDDLNGLKPSAFSSSATTAWIKNTSPLPESRLGSPLPESRLGIVGCPARDDADELALLMFRQMLDPARYELTIMGDETLTSEVIDQIAEQNPAVVCIASLPPGGLAQTRYLCKRLRKRFPDLKIIVGRWGKGNEHDGNSLVAAGADHVGMTISETRDQVNQLSQIISSTDTTDAPGSADGNHLSEK